MKWLRYLFVCALAVLTFGSAYMAWFSPKARQCYEQGGYVSIRGAFFGGPCVKAIELPDGKG